MRPHLIITQADLDAAADGARQIQDAPDEERRPFRERAGQAVAVVAVFLCGYALGAAAVALVAQ